MKKLTLIYGTGNPAKLGAMRRRLADLPVEIVGINDVKDTVSKEAWEQLQALEEDGRSPLENAVKKARSYYKTFGRAVFSCDSGLYFDNVPEEIQPGVHVRTINGKYCSDQEVEDWYTGLARQYGSLKARYHNAICLILEDGREYSLMDESIASEPFLITAIPHERPCQPGFPLDRISIDIQTGKYFYDMDEWKLDQVAVEDGFAVFFRKIMEEI